MVTAKIELAHDDPVRTNFTCTKEREFFYTKFGARTGYLYRNEAEALMVNLGAALDIDVEAAARAMAALTALNDNCWLDEDPCDTEDLAKAKADARSVLGV